MVGYYDSVRHRTVEGLQCSVLSHTSILISLTSTQVPARDSSRAAVAVRQQAISNFQGLKCGHQHAAPAEQ